MTHRFPPRICENCGAEFNPRADDQKYCRPQCRHEFRYGGRND